jgi:outer membrane lipoprotein-sorting protein
VNRFLRTAPTRQLLTAIGAVIAVIAAGTAIAIAAQGPGPVPPAKPLAAAIHQALAARSVTGLSARISFTNNLIGSSEIQGSSPLLSGGSGRLWYSAGHGFRLELQGDNGDANLVVRNGSFWAYDPSSNTVYEGSLPAHAVSASASDRHASGWTTYAPRRRYGHARDAIPTVVQIQREITRALGHLRLSRAIPGDVAGRPTYTLRVAPRASGGLLGAAELAWDAVRGVPLRLALYARGDSTPVLVLSVSGVSYGSVPRSVFSISPPSGAKVVHVSLPTGTATGKRTTGPRHLTFPKLPFTLAAPDTLVGLQRTSVGRLGKDGAVVLYGHGLGTIVVMEQLARGGSTQLSAAPEGGQPGLALPSVQIAGASGQELDTALGTVIRFSRGGIEYTVLGSVTPSVAKAAARAL